MRDYRDSKAMARTLREALAAKNYKISVGESLEMIAHLFGVSDWNTLSALIKNSPDAPSRPVPFEPPPLFSRDLETTLHRALEAATERRQHIATLEHLLLALTEDPNAIGMMNAAGLDVASTREWLARSADDAAPREAGYVPEPTPSEAFQRVVQRAIHDAQASGERPTTGAHVLLAIMLEHDSTAVRILWMEGLDLALARKSARQG